MKKLFGIMACAILFVGQPSFVALAASNASLSSEYAYSFYDPRDEGLARGPLVLAQNNASQPDRNKEKDNYDNEYQEEGSSLQGIPDPLEGLNRAIFTFNDRMYFYVFKPVGQGLKFVLPEPVRVAVRNFFYNLWFPDRFLNCLFQFKFEGGGSELARFLVNSTAGVGGLFDIASKAGLKHYDEDFGLTLGHWGLGNGFYLVIPFFGPSSLRDGTGLIVDGFMWPPTYLDDLWIPVAMRAGEALNKVSLSIGEYEALKGAALDPYIAIRDAYYQYRQHQIKE